LDQIDPLTTHEPPQGEDQPEVYLRSFLNGKNWDSRRFDFFGDPTRPKTANQGYVLPAIDPFHQLEQLLFGPADVEFVNDK
jgi:hypothetical protein